MTAEGPSMRRELVAVNTAPDSENRMHGDEARRYGFSSGLVPGVEVLAYLAHDGVATWGPEWLAAGRLTGRLIAPVYDGETVEVVSTATDDTLRTSVRGIDDADDVVRASAELSRLTDADRAELLGRADPAGFAVKVPPEPGDRPPAAAHLLEPGTVLATQWATFHADRAQSYLDEISETDPAFRTRGLAHPGWLLRFANWALSTTVRLGPWIHVSSDARLLDAVRDGDHLEVRARVVDRFDRKGHQFVDLTAIYLVDERTVAVVDHRAIWEPRLAT
jgi:acyl dehydratase